jgi:hypothetical protein
VSYHDSAVLFTPSGKPGSVRAVLAVNSLMSAFLHFMGGLTDCEASHGSHQCCA